MTVEQMKAWIDNASYEQLLSRWRFGKVGDPFFVGEVGEHYVETMKDKRSKISEEELVRISKAIGWEPR